MARRRSGLQPMHLAGAVAYNEQRRRLKGCDRPQPVDELEADSPKGRCRRKRGEARQEPKGLDRCRLSNLAVFGC